MIMVIKKILIIVLTCIISSMSSNVQAENKWIVRKIEVVGLHRIPLNQVLSNICIHINQLISKKDLDNAIYSLFLTKKFENIKVFRLDHTLIFQLQEKLIISHISLLGTQILSIDQLKINLQKLGIIEGHYLDLFTINIFKKQLISFYQKVGKYKFTIDIRLKILHHGFANINIYLFDGYFYQLNKVEITGTKNFSLKNIYSLSQTYQKLLWWNIVGDKNYYPKILEDDLNTIQHFYFRKGYIHFFFNFIKLSRDNYNKNISIMIDIHEGQQYHISNILINGKFSNYCTKFIQLLHFHPGEIYNIFKINNLKSKIVKNIVNYGYNNVQVEIIPEFNESKKTVEIQIHIVPGIRYFIHHVYFKGNKYTNNSILFNIVHLIPGDIFRKNDCYHAQKMLMNTNFFKHVDVNIHSVANDSSKIDVVFNIKEKHSSSLNFNSGYGLETGVSINLNLIHNNWFGSGQLFKINTLNNNYQTYGEIVLANPYWTKDGKIFTNRIFYDQFKGGYSHFSDYMDKRFGLNSSIGYILDKHNQLQVGIGYIHNGLSYIKSKVFRFHDLLNNFNKFVHKQRGDSDTDDFSINYFLKNHYLLSSNKQMLKNISTLTGKITIPGSDNSFYKFILDNNQSVFLDKLKHFRLLLHSQLGIGDTWLLNKKMPFYENFYAGGLRSVRGFYMNSIGPQLITYDTTMHSCIQDKKNSICQIHNFIGGNYMVVTNVDLFFPNLIFDKIKKNKFSTSLFLDVGTVWDRHWKNMFDSNFWNKTLSYKNPNKIHSSIGITLRWNTSLGKIIISYAKPIGNYDRYKIEKFQFNIGNVF
ncbi:Outer membrane protein assembly factor BamA [Buchnera aphidicola (Eriosoma lanigerum)]|uniref:outer membrane protein assembly factor BamA n=1 Tax=Buchnera aphidicola TaxID=9 RepID=UPI0034640F39